MDHPIQIYCRQTGITQRALAKLAGLHPQEISNIIHGIRRPGPVPAARIARATNNAIRLRDLRPDLLRLIE